MSAQEFGEWKAWYQLEQQQPEAELQRHAQILAATMNGPVRREAGGLFRASEFMPQQETAPVAIKQPTPADLAAQVAAINARFD